MTDTPNMSIEEVPAVKQFKAWFERDLARFAPWDESVICTGGEGDPKNGPTYHFAFFTDRNRYSITVSERYLGCISQSRKPRAGEDWNRGRDLADGPFCEATWQNILADIVSYELVRVHQTKTTPLPASANGGQHAHGGTDAGGA